jgi:hypothetical protein
LQGGGLQRVDEGILVNSMSGLRFGMVREQDRLAVVTREGKVPESFRIYAISNMALGRDEKVYMSRSTIDDFNPLDPFFTRTRDLNAVDLIIDVPPATATTAPSREPPDLNDALDDFGNLSELFLDDAIDLGVDSKILATEPSYLSNLLASLQSLLSADTPLATIPSSYKAKPPQQATPQRYAIDATLPLGPGAVPLPDTADPDLVFSVANSLVWSSIYVHSNQLCDEKLSIDIPKQHQVIAIPRGGCSFSTKLRNIPAFPPDAASLQLVVIVSFPEYEADPRKAPGLVQPLLDEAQYTPSGLPRPHPIPLIMISGGEEGVSLLKRAKGVGVRRRYYFQSQGVRIGNLIVL